MQVSTSLAIWSSLNPVHFRAHLSHIAHVYLYFAAIMWVVTSKLFSCIHLQFYCNGQPGAKCGTSSKAVAIRNVQYFNIQGTANARGPRKGISFQCSKSVPCCGLSLQSINFTSSDPFVNNISPSVVNAHGFASPNVLPVLEDDSLSGQPCPASSFSSTSLCH